MSEESTADAVLTFEWTNFNSPSMAVVMTVAEATGKNAVELKPLYEVVDPDMLNKLFSPTNYSRRTPNGQVDFEYHDYRVVVKANGRGYLYESEALTSPPAEVVITECAE